MHELLVGRNSPGPDSTKLMVGDIRKQRRVPVSAPVVNLRICSNVRGISSLFSPHFRLPAIKNGKA